ncbi:hypothetical protein BDN72DRAFT_844796 [Pluteus cervinus]|uniref:Uncharacterized protein n=1 Tax=Pluteus cervinus TaxID=181527 RepID=A0ACD3ALG5_9AGAR|nr:hypothetical protein BDN72DRAFT_844796 [Pluteus cervinus]
MVVLKIIPGEIITSDGFFELLRETSQETRLNWTKYIEARLSKWEELMPILNPSLPNIVFTASNSNRKLTIEPSRVPYDRYQPRSQYPVRFRIPPTTLSGLSQRDCVIRAMRFALGSLIFMIMTGTPPFEELDDGAVEKEYKRGHYPGDVIYLQERIMIEVLQYWSREFGEAWLHISGCESLVYFP